MLSDSESSLPAHDIGTIMGDMAWKRFSDHLPTGEEGTVLMIYASEVAGDMCQATIIHKSACLDLRP